MPRVITGYRHIGGLCTRANKYGQLTNLGSLRRGLWKRYDSDKHKKTTSYSLDITMPLVYRLWPFVHHGFLTSKPTGLIPSQCILHSAKLIAQTNCALFVIPTGLSPVTLWKLNPKLNDMTILWENVNRHISKQRQLTGCL